MLQIILWWSWRESNPRPNRETIRFLHAYLGLHFRAATRPKPPITALSPKISSRSRSAPMTISDFPAPLYLPDSEQHPEERCLVPSPSGGIKPVNYCTSFRQRERTCFRQLIFRPNGLWSIQPSLRMLTYHLSPLSNPVNPKKMYFALQSYEKSSAKQNKSHLFFMPRWSNLSKVTKKNYELFCTFAINFRFSCYYIYGKLQIYHH